MAKHVFTGMLYGWLLTIVTLSGFSVQAQQTPLLHAYAHNDYWHKRPLYDALNNGFTYLEADVWVRNGKLLVAHRPPIFGKHPHLQSLYLQPLADLFLKNGTDENFTTVDSVVLMIDIKSNGKKTYQLLKELLAPYQSILSGYENGIVTRRQLTIVLTGKRPLDMLRAETTRYMFADANIENKAQTMANTGLYLTASGRYSSLVSWNGQYGMHREEKERLKQLVSEAHTAGQKVRLWASPENERVWMELLDCGVDLINTDKLDALRKFLTADLSRL